MKDNENMGLLSGPAVRIRKRAIGFKSNENGSMIVFGLFIFIIMLGAGGMAVDFMRAERERAQLQYTLDRAVLASAALSNPLDPKTVVEDYFRKAGYPDGLVETTLPNETGINFKTVRADARARVGTFFIKTFGINKLDVVASGSAEERIQNMEISMVLDVSGSMGNKGKLAKMKEAAKEFVDTMLTDENEDYVSINIIPYNMQVNVGEYVMDELRLSDQHDYSNCVDFRRNDYSTIAISTADTYAQTAHFDPFTQTVNHPDFTEDDYPGLTYMCPTSAASEILLMSNDKDQLKAKIDSLQHGGNTSIDIGVKWGTFFLDPSAQTVLDGIRDQVAIDSTGDGSGSNSPDFPDRPASYEDKDTIKVLVVLTDGENTAEYKLDSDYKNGMSPVWKENGSDTLHVFNTRGLSRVVQDRWGNRYWQQYAYFETGSLPENTKKIIIEREEPDYSQGAPAGATKTVRYIRGDSPYVTNRGYSFDWRNPANSTRLSWAQVWDMMSVRYYADYLIRRQDFDRNIYGETVRSALSAANTTEKDNRLSAVCTAAKNTEIVVYSIGFEVTDRSAAEMQKCASSKANFFRVQDKEISDAFNAIAKTIQRLKLIN